MRNVVLFTVGALSLMAFADAAVVAPPTFLDGILAFLAAHPAGSISTIVGFIAELVMRFYPSNKALSLLVPVVYGVDGIAVMLGWLSAILKQMITSAQNLAATQPKP